MHTANIPVLETKRLILRGPEAEDYPTSKPRFQATVHALWAGL